MSKAKFTKYILKDLSEEDFCKIKPKNNSSKLQNKILISPTARIANSKRPNDNLTETILNMLTIIET